jgi:hypothetical protein
VSGVAILFGLSALIGLVLGGLFSWVAVPISAVAIAMLSATVLRVYGFDLYWGAATVGACLAVNQAAYVAGLFARRFTDRRETGSRTRREGRSKGLGRRRLR